MARHSENEFRVKIKGLFCIYCGENANCFDHFPPYSACLRGFLLPACNECNNLAGTVYPYDFEARCQHVKDGIRWKYRRVLATPDWSFGEMRALGYTLNRKIKAWQDLRKITQGRIVWNAISYLSLFEDGRNFAQLNAEIGTMPENAPQAFEKLANSYREIWPEFSSRKPS